ncbi:class I SAM-dependent methyltransferase [Alkalihalobacillus sp. LMS39]|uniref:class I SAM-dependent methyltransferase n=1 Tax=Alkalihalobacillus sp. LMS39 TaxID=2924032 RepID=UPI001FB1DAE7|nr:class I SAM-dependent methyltransferase [Alkalihalobacillus sp. LMS39]UOE95845.1 class I SAM-dependent methyltransferase [Alkalihalobacillus sp. LMS39]
MTINFHSHEHQKTYTTRNADRSWIEAIRKLVEMETVDHALDIGCGGGIYAKALSDTGVSKVTGVDFSESMLEGAKENCQSYENISLKYGTAYETGLENTQYDLIIQRALIHHLDDLQRCFQEAYRVLKRGGTFIIQDRTPEDCFLKGDRNHIRGYFFERFPQLMNSERARRYKSKTVVTALRNQGFTNIEEMKLWETRKVYEQKDELLQDIKNRTGRSLLHALDDNEVSELTDFIRRSLPQDGPIVEKDRWTIWKAMKNAKEE